MASALRVAANAPSYSRCARKLPGTRCTKVHANSSGSSGHDRTPSDIRAAHTSTEDETGTAAKEHEPTDFDALYRPVDVDGAKYQTIITKPRGSGRHPAVLLIGGLGCYSLDQLKSDEAYAQLLYGLTHKGYVTIRVEKNGE